MKTKSLCRLLMAASFASTCSITSALAQTVVFLNGKKVLLDARGNVVEPRPASALPGAPLVGGADSCTTPDVVVGAGPFAFDNTVATTGTQGQTESLCFQFGTTGISNDVWFT